MKKTIIWIIIALVSGAVLGNFTFDSYENLDTEKVISLNDKVYMIKYGTYGNEEEMAENVTDVDRYVYINDNGKFSAYVGASTSLKNAKKVIDVYAAKKINLTLDKISIDSDEFIQNLNEYEKLLDATEDEKSILIIQKQILSCYDSTVVKYE